MSASRVLASRAAQCSFSSIFHLQKAGINQADFKLIKTSFIGIIVLPGAVFAAAFLKQQLIK